MIVKRDMYLQMLIDRMNNGAIKIITGLRRSGKSTLLFKIFYDYLLSIGNNPNNIIKIDLDSEEYEDLLDYKKLGQYVRSKINQIDKYYVFLDEVQLCKNFEKVLNGLNRIENLDIYVTGSNSKFLSSDILTEFRGRGDEIRIYPLSFSEYYSALTNVEFSIAFNDYIIYGGLPRLLALKTEQQKSKYLIDLFKETYIKDIIDRYQLRGEETLDKLVDILASSVGSLTSPNKLSKTAMSVLGKNISDKTIRTYIELLKDAFLINEAKRYDIKGKQYLSSLQKYYYSDLGLRNARLNFRQNEQSHLMENLIYNELLYRGYNVDIGIVEINDKTNGKYAQKQIEIDFVCNQGSKRYYIQSVYALTSENKINQELRPLYNVKDFFKKIVIVRDDIKPYCNEQGITIMGIRYFLLNNNSLEF